MRAEDLRAYKRRWDLVEERRRSERASETYEQRFRDLEILMRSARAHGWETHTAEENASARARWMLLLERSRARRSEPAITP